MNRNSKLGNDTVFHSCPCCPATHGADEFPTSPSSRRRARITSRRLRHTLQLQLENLDEVARAEGFSANQSRRVDDLPYLHICVRAIRCTMPNGHQAKHPNATTKASKHKIFWCYRVQCQTATRRNIRTRPQRRQNTRYFGAIETPTFHVHIASYRTVPYRTVLSCPFTYPRDKKRPNT